MSKKQRIWVGVILIVVITAFFIVTHQEEPESGTIVIDHNGQELNINRNSPGYTLN